jgi:hypothetical protein
MNEQIVENAFVEDEKSAIINRRMEKDESIAKVLQREEYDEEKVEKLQKRRKEVEEIVKVHQQEKSKTSEVEAPTQKVHPKLLNEMPQPPPQQPTTHHGSWRFNQKKLYKACKELHDECHIINDKFILMGLELSQFKRPEDCLVATLRAAYKRFRITLPEHMWLEMICDCLMGANKK